MKKILCFGDSNTFGFIPKNMKRYKENERWSGILKEKLSHAGFAVTEAGCNNRTCFIKKETQDLTGYLAIQKYLKDEYDYIILSLGINDLQKFYKPSDDDFIDGFKNIIGIIKEQSFNTKILLLSPSRLNENILNGFFAQLFDNWAIEKSKTIFNLYEKIAKEENCEILNLDSFAVVSNTDGLHYETKEHQKIAEKLYQYFINQIN